VYVLITYDVSTKSAAGERRLRRVAKMCVRYGQRVQNSVFECSLDPGQYELLKHSLLEEIDEKCDSLRFYNLGKNWHSRVEQFGSKRSYDPEGFLCI
jgi:CRISPR-associated protein Cas2